MGRKVTAADIQVEIAKGAFRPHMKKTGDDLAMFFKDAV